MLFLTFEIQLEKKQPSAQDDSVQASSTQRETKLPLESFIQVDPTDESDVRKELFRDIQRAVDRRLGPDTKLLQIYGTYGSPEPLFIILLTGGVVAGYNFVKDYPDLRKGVPLLRKDIGKLFKKLTEGLMPSHNVEVNQKYPPQISDDISKIRRENYSDIFRVSY